MASELFLPFTAHVIDNKILAEPVQIPLMCDKYIILGVRLSKDWSANYDIIGVENFQLSHEGRVFGNKYFTLDLWLQYSNIMCYCQGSNCPPYPDDNQFLLANGCVALVNGLGLLL